MKTILFVLAFCLLCACAAQETPISREQAIQRARDLATINQPEIEATIVPLTNIRAERMKLEDAFKRVMNNDGMTTGQDAQRLVWLVTMDGEWRNVPPMPIGTSTQTALKRFTLIIDATTGDTLGSTFTP